LYLAQQFSKGAEWIELEKFGKTFCSSQLSTTAMFSSLVSVEERMNIAASPAPASAARVGLVDAVWFLA